MTEARGESRPATAEETLKELGIKLPSPPEPFGIYAEAVQTGNLLFLTGMLPTEGRAAKFIVRAELDVEAGRKAARTSRRSTAWQVARGYLGSLDKVIGVFRQYARQVPENDVERELYAYRRITQAKFVAI